MRLRNEDEEEGEHMTNTSPSSRLLSLHHHLSIFLQYIQHPFTTLYYYKYSEYLQINH